MDLKVSESTKYTIIIATIITTIICVCVMIGINYYYPSSNVFGICIAMGIIFIFIIAIMFGKPTYGYPQAYYPPQPYFAPPPSPPAPLFGITLGNFGTFSSYR